ncbi:MAG: hypothetical protein ACRAVC_03150, partial [Trichormus sp.]
PLLPLLPLLPAPSFRIVCAKGVQNALILSRFTNLDAHCGTVIRKLIITKRIKRLKGLIIQKIRILILMATGNLDAQESIHLSNLLG